MIDDRRSPRDDSYPFAASRAGVILGYAWTPKSPSNSSHGTSRHWAPCAALMAHRGRSATPTSVGWGGTPDCLTYLFGDGLDVDEIKEHLDDFEGTLGPRRLPFNDDSSGNFLVVDSDGAVYYHLHDAYLERNEPRIADSFEQFVLMLQRGR